MKKLLAIILTAFVLCTCVSLVAFAESVPYEAEGECYINGEFDSITFNEKTYLYVSTKNYNVDIYRDDNINLAVKFLDESIGEKYRYVDVNYSPQYPYVLNVSSESKEQKYNSGIFVEESRFDEIESVVIGESVMGYLTESQYDYIGKKLTTDQIQNWINSSEKMYEAANSVFYNESYTLYATDSGGAIRKGVGLILRNYNSYYLVYYPEYERNYFFADGSFAIDSDEMTTFYVLNDAELAAELSTFYDTAPEFEDDLDWMVNDKMPASVFFVITLIIFILAPLAAIVFAVILLRKPKMRDTYKLSLIALCISAALIIIGYTIFVLLIL